MVPRFVGQLGEGRRTPRHCRTWRPQDAAVRLRKVGPGAPLAIELGHPRIQRLKHLVAHLPHLFRIADRAGERVVKHGLLDQLAVADKQRGALVERVGFDVQDGAVTVDCQAAGLLGESRDRQRGGVAGFGPPS